VSVLTGRLWRVGHAEDPLGYAPRELYAFNHRFDDLHRRFRTLYCAERPETCLREVLGDFRPSLAAVERHVARYGPQAAEDVPAAPITARWRRGHVLTPLALELDGALVDLTDVPTRRAVEDRHRALLVEHGLEHLDLHEITTHRRRVTQAIAADLHDRGAAAIRFPSRLDGSGCVALIEGRGSALALAAPTPLTDPPPPALTAVAAGWGMALEPAPPVEG
jgi:hypothetical protein